MQPALVKKRPFWGGVLCGLLFIALGCIFVTYTGVQEDEGAFAAPLYRDWSFYSVRLFHRQVPLMQMPYVGALKTWIYAPLTHFMAPSPAFLRIPALLIGAATILLFGVLLDRVHGRRAAWTGCVLLSTDSIFLLTTTFDWGPVALQHLLLTTLMLCSVLWMQEGRNAWLAAAAFACGLAFWDKAVFVWIFTGLLCGSLVFFRPVRKRLTAPAAAIAVTTLTIAALPLLIYNFRSTPRFYTFRSNSEFEVHDLGDKLSMLRRSWNGSGLFGYMVCEPAGPGAPRNALERAGFVLHQYTGDRRTSLSELALLCAILLTPILWRGRTRPSLLLLATACVIAWVFMAMSGGGGSVHHAVLLWPLPHLFVAVAFAEASYYIRFGAWALGALVFFMGVANFAVTNQYLYQFVRNGPTPIWTDAINGLASAVRGAQASQVVAVDWGIDVPLSVLNKDKPTVRIVADPILAPDASPAQKKDELQLLSDPKTIWVDHTAASEVSSGIHERLVRAARTAGFDQQIIGVYSDRLDRPIFLTFRFIAHR